MATKRPGKTYSSEDLNAGDKSVGDKNVADRKPLEQQDGQPMRDTIIPARTTSEEGRQGFPEAGAEDSIGRHWLKYAGIGSARSSTGSPSQSSPSEITSLGSLEAEIMGILWEIGRPATGMKVMETTLYKRRAHGMEPPSFSSIATTLRRLSDKGLLETHKNETRTPIYWPKVEREQMAARILNNVSKTLLGASLHTLLPKLIGRSSRPASADGEEEHLARLMEALEQVAEKDKRDKAAPTTEAAPTATAPQAIITNKLVEPHE